MLMRSPLLTTEGLRHRNRALVLASMRQFGAMAHTQIAQKTGLASGTISVITAELMAENVLCKVEQRGVNGRGRPRISFAPNPEYARLVMVALMPDAITLSMIDYAGGLMDRQVLPVGTGKQLSDVLEPGVASFVARNKLEKSDVSVISITSRGEVDATERTVVWSPDAAGQDLDFHNMFSAGWTADVVLNNETALVAHSVMLNALRIGRVPSCARLAVVSLSDSISLGVARLTRQGEIEMVSPAFGHMPHVTEGAMCRCGSRGCLESISGFYGILRQAFDGPKDGVPPMFVPLKQVQQIANAARSGDTGAVLAFRQAGEALGMALARLLSVMGTMPVTITGEGLAFFDLMADGFNAQLQGGFLAKTGGIPEVAFAQDDDITAFQSNIFISLQEFDQTLVATRERSAK